MKRFWGLFLACLVASCSSSDDGKEADAKTDSAAPPGPAADATVDSKDIDAAALSTGADAADTEAGATEFGCPVVFPGLNSACASEGAMCDYSSPLNCPVGCSGGDFHGYQCSQGRWVDYRHTAGAPRCQCQALNFPMGMQGTWRFNESSIPGQYAWIRFSALGDTLSDAGTPGQGTIEILAGPDSLMASIPWWSCDGQGRWFITQTPEAFEVRPAATCASSTKSEIYTVTSHQSAIPASLLGCLLHITMESTSGSPMEACKYSDTQCNDAMTTCQTQ